MAFLIKIIKEKYGNTLLQTNKDKLRVLNPRANYADQATAACRRS
jgi:hypothetical protein